MKVQRIQAHEAAAVLAGLDAMDPRGIMTPEDIVAMCEVGQCFRVSGAVDAVYVIQVQNGVAWVDAAKKTGEGDACVGIEAVLVQQAKGLKSMATQTAHAGLVHKLKKQGWRITGWILKKDLPND
jgi:hypothetical protein